MLSVANNHIMRVVMLNGVMLSVVMLIAIMLNVIMLNVVLSWYHQQGWEIRKAPAVCVLHVFECMFH